MKRLLIISFIILACLIVFPNTPAFSQDQEQASHPSSDKNLPSKILISQGTWIIGAGTSLGFSSGSTILDTDHFGKETNNYVDFSITPFVGYFVFKGLEIGPVIGISASDDNDKKNKDHATDVAYSFGIHGRYYIDMDSIVSPFFRLSIGYFNEQATHKVDADLEEDRIDSTMNISGTAFAPGFGVAIFLNPHISLDFLLSYVILDGNGQVVVKNPDATEDFKYNDSSFNASVGISGYF